MKKNISYHKKLKIRRTIIAWSFLSITVVLMGIFSYYSMGFGLVISFANFDFLTPLKWVGFSNYIEALHAPLFWQAIKNSFIYLLVVPPMQFFSLLMAWLVDRKVRGIKIMRAIYMLPMVTSMTVAAISWQWIFQREGILNYFLISLHIINTPISWLTNAYTALFAIMFVTLWKGLGYYMLIYLAGFQSIDDSLIEAGRIDGATESQIFYKIKLPLIMPFILFNSLQSTLGAMGIFTEVYIMTGGGPGTATYTMPMYTYTQAFEYMHFGYAQAVSILFGFVTFIGIIVNFILLRKGWTEVAES